jgi:hypothetical protein
MSYKLVRGSFKSARACKDLDEQQLYTAKALIDKANNFLDSVSDESALTNLAELRELIDVMDMLHEREISRRQLDLRESLGGYDSFYLKEN